jgi:hypothetical protein
MARSYNTSRDRLHIAFHHRKPSTLLMNAWSKNQGRFRFVRTNRAAALVLDGNPMTPRGLESKPFFDETKQGDAGPGITILSILKVV